MARKDIAAGKVKQIKGKANDIAGAVTGNTGRQIKGKAQQAAGKVQEILWKGYAGQVARTLALSTIRLLATRPARGVSRRLHFRT